MSKGIYRIRNKTSGKIYIGSSSNIKKRWKSHIRELNGQLHANPHLQKAWSKYGEKSFVFEVIEILLDEDGLLIREQYFLDKIIRWGFDYNITKIAGRPPSQKGKKKSSEHRNKISDAMSGKNSHMFGKHHSDETKEKMSKIQAGEGNPSNFCQPAIRFLRGSWQADFQCFVRCSGNGKTEYQGKYYQRNEEYN